MKCLFTWTERRLLRLFRKLSTRQNLHLKAEMFSFHSKYFVHRELKRAPQKLSFCFNVRILVPSGYRATYCNGKNCFCFVIKTDYFDVIVSVAVKPLLLTLCWNNKKLEYLTWKLAFRHPYFSRDQKAMFWKTFQRAFSKSCAFSVTIFTSFSWQTVSSKYGYIRTGPKFVHSVGLVKCQPLNIVAF